MARPALLAALLCVAAAAGVNGQLNNAVTQWNKALEGVLQTYGVKHQNGLRFFALLHYSQLIALTKNLRFTDDLVVATASHHLLSEVLPDPQSAVYDVLIGQQLANYSTTIIAKAFAFVTPIVNAIIVSRLSDGSQSYVRFAAAPPGSVGQYQLTPGQTYYLYPQLANTIPFFPYLSLNFYPGYAPYPVNSTDFLNDLLYVYSVGSASSTNATNSTIQTAFFWQDGAGTSQHGGHWNIISLLLLPSNLTLLQTAKILALLNTAAFDAAIITWRLKYSTLFWRPVTAIRQGISGFEYNGSTWTPVLSTPPHPEYPSGHSTSAGAFGYLLTTILGGDAINVAVPTEGKDANGQPLAPRTYTSIQDIVTEINYSRVYGGVHFLKAVLDGAAVGQKVAHQALQKFTNVFGALLK
jgi:membrane-associated phospholipid phosphatase